MSTFARFRPFLKPYLPRMVVAGLLVMAVAAINLALLRLAGLLWDVITIHHDSGRMNEMIALFLGLVVVQGLCSMGHSYLTASASQHIVADFSAICKRSPWGSSPGAARESCCLA